MENTSKNYCAMEKIRKKTSIIWVKTKHTVKVWKIYGLVQNLAPSINTHIKVSNVSYVIFLEKKLSVGTKKLKGTKK